MMQSRSPSQERQDQGIIMMSSFLEDGENTATELNNMGVSCLERRQFVEAHNLFREALAHTYSVGTGGNHHPEREGSTEGQTNTTCPQNEEDSPPLAGGTDGPSPLVVAVPNSLLRRHPANATSSPHSSAAALPMTDLQRYYEHNDASSSSGDFCSFHARALKIGTQFVQYQSSSPLGGRGASVVAPGGPTICSAVITFNLALVYHTMGVLGYSGSTKLLGKANMLYQKCHLLLFHGGILDERNDGEAWCSSPSNLHEHDSDHRPLANPTIDILQMAILTNLAHLNLEVSDFNESYQYQTQLMDYFASIGPLYLRYRDHDDGRLVQFMEEQKANYLLNLYILRPPHVAGAA